MQFYSNTSTYQLGSISVISIPYWLNIEYQAAADWILSLCAICVQAYHALCRLFTHKLVYIKQTIIQMTHKFVIFYHYNSICNTHYNSLCLYMFFMFINIYRYYLCCENELCLLPKCCKLAFEYVFVQVSINFEKM